MCFGAKNEQFLEFRGAAAEEIRVFVLDARDAGVVPSKTITCDHAGHGSLRCGVRVWLYFSLTRPQKKKIKRKSTNPGGALFFRKADLMFYYYYY